MFSNSERDSTAISDTESQFFVLQKEVLNKMQQTFEKEFGEIETLARKRRKRHKKLIKNLVRKCRQIYKERPEESLKNLDFEFHLLMMEEFNVDEEPEVAQNDPHLIDAKAKGSPKLKVGEILIEKVSESHDSDRM